MGLDFLKDVSVDDAMKSLDDIKAAQKKRNDYIMKNTKKFHNYSNRNPMKTKTMHKVFSIPAIVYAANPDYWNYIIREKKFNLHPEFQAK